MKTQIFIIFLILFSMVNPLYSQLVIDTTGSQMLNRAQPEQIIKEYPTSTGTIFTIKEIKYSDQTSDIFVGCKSGKEKYPYIFGATYPIKEIKTADINSNGFEEIYIICESPGSMKYPRLYCFSSLPDTTIIKKITFSDPEGIEFDNIYNGFVGHAKYDIIANNFIVTFPVYSEKSTSDTDTQVYKKVYYILDNYEMTYQKTEQSK